MVPLRPPTPVGGTQSIPNSLLRSNSGLMCGAQSNPIPSQQRLSSLVSPHTQFTSNNNNGGMNLLGNLANVSSLFNETMGNGMSLQQLQQLGPENDPLALGHTMNQLTSVNHSQSQQLEAVQNFQQQFSVPQQQQQQQQQQQLRGGLGNVGGLGPVKLEQQTDQNGPTQQQLQSLRSFGAVKMEQQQMQPMRGLGPVKLEQQLSDSALFLQQQQHQQLMQMQMSRQNPQTAAQLNMIQQQRILQMQMQQNQQQVLKGLPPRNQLQQQQQQQQQPQQTLSLRPQMKPNNYEPGICPRRLTQYMYHQQHRPQDNNIEFWRKFVTEYFAPNAKKRWCVSLYGSGRQTSGVFPQDVWHCEICSRKPGRGFETTAEVLPRLCQIKYASGTLEELLYVDMPRETHNAMGQIVLDYPKAIQECVFEQLRVVRDGHLRIVFNPDLKISSWEFCARRHEELIPRKLIIPQVSQLGAVVQKYQNTAQGTSTQDLQNSCNSFVTSARQLAKAWEVPLVNDLGYTKRYVRCLQISEVVNSMKDLIDYSSETKTGPMESLVNFPRRTSGLSGLHSQQQQAQQPREQHQTMGQNANHNDQSSAHSTITQLASFTNGNSVNGPPSTSQSTTTIVGLLHNQNSMNSRQESQLGTTQIPSTSSSSSLPPSQPNPSSPFSPPTPTTSNNNTISTSRNLNPVTMQQQQITQPQEDANGPQSSVQQIIQEMMMSSPPNGVSSLGNGMKGMNGVAPGANGGAMTNNSGICGNMGFGSANMSGLRATMVNNAMAMSGRIEMSQLLQDPTSMNHQQKPRDVGNRLMGGLGNNFGNLHYDWKTSP